MCAEYNVQEHPALRAKQADRICTTRNNEHVCVEISREYKYKKLKLLHTKHIVSEQSSNTCEYIDVHTINRKL